MLGSVGALGREAGRNGGCGWSRHGQDLCRGACRPWALAGGAARTRTRSGAHGATGENAAREELWGDGVQWATV